MAQWVKNPTAAAGITMKARVQSPGQCSRLKNQAAACVQSLAQEVPYAMDVAIKKKKLRVRYHCLEIIYSEIMRNI